MSTFTSLLFFLTFMLAACTPNSRVTEPIPTPRAETPFPAIETQSRDLSTAQIPSLTASLTADQTSKTPVIHLDQSIIDIPNATPTFDEQCSGAYPAETFFISWATDAAIKTLDPNAEGWVEATVQSCTDKNGKTYNVAFGTWFYVDKPTPDLKDYEAFGSWIVDVMNMLDTIPRDEVTINAEPTTVYFRFYKDASVLDVRVPIKKYLTEVNGKSGEELFRIFYTTP